jgi:DNA-directed RNA polymerase specialized sigma24 family protein
VEPVVTEPRDELAAVPDIIGTDGEDFSAFATSRWPGLVRLAFGLTGDRWLAEDIAQTTLARAYVAWRRVSRADDPDAYLRRILVNTSHRRFRRRRVTEQPGDPPDTPVEGPADLVGDRAAVLAGPDRRADRRHPGLLAGHGSQPALPGPGQAPGQPGSRRK